MPGIVEFVELVVNLSVFVPVSNLGFASTFGFGILKVALNCPIESDINLTSVTVASAPVVCPTSFMSFWTFPKKLPCTWVERLNVSTFKTVEDVEYTVEIPEDPPRYGFNVATFVGALYGPSLWFGDASLNENSLLLTVPFTVSPVWKTPLVMLTSINLGVTKLVTSTLSK